MHLFLSIIIVIGFIVVAVLSTLSVVTDLLVINKYRPPLLSDEDPEGDWEAEDRSRQGTSSYAVDARANRSIATDINAAHWP